MAKLIVVEGLDGSGKATQAALLTKRLQKNGQAVQQISFPDYQNKSSTLVKMYLDGEIGDVNDVNGYAASVFYAADRYISYVSGWKKQYLAGYTIVADRYTTSNAAHQMSKLPQTEWDTYLDWLSDFEYQKMALPRPDMVLYLDVPPAVSRTLLYKRYGNQHPPQDIHERNLAYLLQCREAALYAAQRLGWIVVNCCDGGQLQPIEAISNLLWQQIHPENQR